MSQPLPQPIPEPLAELIAERFRLLAEPMRLRILDRLRAEEVSVGELAATLGTSQQNVSKHVAALVDAGIVARRKVGTSVRLSIADDTVFDLCERVCGGIAARLADLQSMLDGTGVPR